MTDPLLLPEGDGHPVIIFPGLGDDKRSLVPLRDCCESLGYAVYDWEHGFNSGCESMDAWLRNVAEHVSAVAGMHSRRVSLVGWSQGGIAAHQVASLRPERVRHVVTLGACLRERPPVPTTSIYSRGDGVLAWQTRLLDRDLEADDLALGPDGQLSLPHHPHVLRLVADRLRRPEQPWQLDTR